MKTKDELIDTVIETLIKQYGIDGKYDSFREIFNEVRLSSLKIYLPVDKSAEFSDVLDDKLYSIWCTEDVIDRGREMQEVDLTEDQAKEILSDMDSNVGADVGVSWDSMDVYIDQFIEDMKEAGTPVKEFDAEDF